MTPLPGGFPADKAVENAASVRVSRPGLDFVEKQVGGIVAQQLKAPNGKMAFGVPEIPFDVKDAFSFGPCSFLGLCVHFDVVGKVCPGGPNTTANPPKCTAEVNLTSAKFQIDAVTPNALMVSAQLPLQLDDTAIDIDVNPGPAKTISVGYGINAKCVGSDLSKTEVDPKVLAVKVTIPLVAETIAPRRGYTKIDVDGATIDLSALNADDVHMCTDCGPFSDIAGFNICNSVLNIGALKDAIVGQLKGQLDGQVKSLLRDQLCTKPNPTLAPPCPTDTSPGGAYCVYDADKSKCVPTLLGTDSHIELGGLLGSISPGTEGGLDFGLASFGSMRPAPGLDPNTNGITLGMIGGVLPQPPSKCVVQKPVTPPTGIPIPDEISPTAAEPGTAPHVGIALAGRFLDYAMTSVYNSGLLCLGVSTEQVDLLKSGLLAFLIPSIKSITFEQSDAAAAVATRPQAPPVVKIGGGTDVNKDPLLLVTLPQFALDFYIWSFDRYARVFTYTGDLTIPVNLQTGKSATNPNGGLAPAIGEIKVSNGSVSNADILLMDDPEVVAGAVGGIFGTVSKQLVGGGFAPIDVSSALGSFGLGLEVNDIKKLTKGTDDFIGIFATMSAKAPAATVEAETRARLVDKRVWKDHLQAATFDAAKLPELEVELGAEVGGAGRPVEYSWWIDGGTRAPWAPLVDRFVVKDGQLFLQGKHVLHVTTRIVGDAATEDATPVDISYVIDALAPFVKLDRDADGVKLKTWDLVSDHAALVARYRLGDGAFTEWSPATSLDHLATGKSATIDVEVRDEEGNIGTVRQELIRGRSDPTIAAAGSGCSCSTPGHERETTNGLYAIGLGAFALALIAMRRRNGRVPAGLALGALGVFAAASQGCSCGGSGDDKSGCGQDCNQTCSTGLGHGQPGAYLSVAKSKDGAIWAAGYNDSLLSNGDSFIWGDLVVGKYDNQKDEVAWEVVDGIPVRTDGTCASYEPNGWRKGETEAGDDVGRYASIQVSTANQPMVSYYDDTNHRLKFAINDGGWQISVLRELPNSDIGRYSKMVIVDGKPAIAFLHLEPGSSGKLRSKVVLARAHVESPHGPDDFDFDDVAVDEDGPCRASTCTDGQVCVKATGVCTKPVNGCTPACGDSDVCVNKDNKAICQPKANPIETFPRVMGDYISLAKGPKHLGIALYDGFHGNLIGLFDQGKLPWDHVILDGESGRRSDKTAIDTGDVGSSASLAITSDGTWNVSYVSGVDESLRYLTIKPDGTVTRPEIVDDGTKVDGNVHPDGKHIVGDDSAIRADGSKITIYYADSTSLGLRRASSPSAGATHTWDLASVKQDNRWVAFPQWIPDEERVAAWWRASKRAEKTVDGNVTVIGSP